MSTALWGSLLPRLVAHGLLDGDATLTGRVTVESRDRSHHVAVIRQGARAVCVAKHHRDSPDPGDPSDTEVAVYRWLATHPRLGGPARDPSGAAGPGPAGAPGEEAGPAVAPGEEASPSVTPGEEAGPAVAPGWEAGPAVAPGEAASPAVAPALLDVAGDTLLLEACVDDLPLHLALRDASWPPATLLAALGHLLGRLHAADDPPHHLGGSAGGAGGDRGTAPPAPGTPWVVAVADGVLPPSLAGDGRIAELAGEVAGDPGLADCLRALGARWPGGPAGRAAAAPQAVLVHGDVKFDNVLVQGAPGPEGAAAVPRLRLLDWELAGPGLAAWDLAGIADGLLVPALQVLPTAQALGERDHAQPALDAHRAVPGAPRIDAQDLRIATVARLVQSAIQLLAMRHQQPGREAAVAPVLAGARALAQPRMAAAV